VADFVRYCVAQNLSLADISAASQAFYAIVKDVEEAGEGLVPGMRRLQGKTQFGTFKGASLGQGARGEPQNQMSRAEILLAGGLASAGQN